MKRTILPLQITFIALFLVYPWNIESVSDFGRFITATGLYLYSIHFFKKGEGAGVLMNEKAE